MRYTNSLFYQKVLKKISEAIKHDHFNIINLKSYWKGAQTIVFVQIMEYKSEESYRLKELEVMCSDDNMCVYNAYGVKLA